MKLLINNRVEDDITQMLELTEEYDHTFGLYDHRSEKDLLSVFYQHPEEDPVTHSRLEIMAMELITLRIPELTNESLTDLLDYPRWFLDRLIKRVKPLREKERKALEGLQNPENDKK